MGGEELAGRQRPAAGRIISINGFQEGWLDYKGRLIYTLKTEKANSSNCCTISGTAATRGEK